VLLQDGVIEQQGAPLDLFERPATRFVAGFLGSPAINFIPADLVSEGGAVSLRLKDGRRLDLPPARTASLATWIGKPTILGVRPEHMALDRGGSVRPGFVVQEVVIDLVQPTGSRLYGTFMLGGQEAVAELGAHDVSRPGERVNLLFDMNRAILIDPETERVL
jgi:multiple sugar transport system ATP-binding protein